MNTLVQDIRYAARQLGKRPGFTAVAVLTIALGLGANTAIFSVIGGVLLRPLPYQQPERVVNLWNSYVGGNARLSEPELVEYRREIDSFEGLGAYTPIEADLTGGPGAEKVAAARVTVNLIDVLGAHPVLGRTFTAREGEPGRDRVAIIGYGLWQRRFGGDASVIGAPLRVNQRDRRTIVGVMPPEFALPVDFQKATTTELWVPLPLDPDHLHQRGRRSMLAVARLGPGATVEGANAELDVLTRRWVEQGVTDLEQFSAFIAPVKDEVVGRIRPVLLVLLGAAGFVLLIACTNVANLFLARTDERHRELALRKALGAQGGRIVRQLLTESVLLAVIGGAMGLLLAYMGVEALVALDPASVPRLGEVVMDARVLAFAGAATLVTGLIFGAVPAIRAFGSDLSMPLKEYRPGPDSGRSGPGSRRALVVIEVALAVVLVIGAGLMIRSLWELRQIELGFDPENVLTMRLSLTAADYPESDDVVAFYRRLVDRVEGLPRVRSAGAAAVLPLANSIADWDISIEGQPDPPGTTTWARLQVVTPGYFETMGLTLLRGRFLRVSDGPGAVPAVVINEALAETHWPERGAIGKRLRLSGGDNTWFTIVGILRNVRHNTVVRAPAPQMYFPHAQLPLSLGGAVNAMTLTAKTTSDPLAVVSAVRGVVRSLDPNLPVSAIQTVEHVVDAAFSERRFLMLLLVTFAGLALVLGAVGIYGVTAYMVSRRRREVGIRMVLGAPAGEMLAMVLRQSAAHALAGVGLGLVAAFALTRVMSSLLYEVSATDPLVFAGVALLLTAVALLASYIPARRAARVDPVTALRHE